MCSLAPSNSSHPISDRAAPPSLCTPRANHSPPSTIQSNSQFTLHIILITKYTGHPIILTVPEQVPTVTHHHISSIPITSDALGERQTAAHALLAVWCCHLCSRWPCASLGEGRLTTYAVLPSAPYHPSSYPSSLPAVDGQNQQT